ncbi:uncharacterized protein BP5553_10675 [Venustampulla echinocandica]|uniref:NAD(P)-binding protein n=1 Tax=Venustampulla echinocandica TaxID=2656787 RepID=A0A370T8R2_9HELO|nr:uncharacterized protein BP5553_10675 [Venustampulla echinocandica]RDL29810.1 hypothetical protein BP5553_10675 [Venustampulla echinocandica]
MDKNMIIIVTGSNRGLGQAIRRLLAQTSHDPPLTIYATSRESVPLDIKPLHNNLIHFEQLDITSALSIQSLISKINPPVDILINNAAVALDREYNYENTVNSYPKDIQEQFSSSWLTLAGLDNPADIYLQSVKADMEEESRWNYVKGSFNVGKSCVNALTAVLSRLINCCCPGWNKTDVGSLGGDLGKDPMKGAKIPVKLAIGDIGEWALMVRHQQQRYQLEEVAEINFQIDLLEKDSTKPERGDTVAVAPHLSHSVTLSGETAGVRVPAECLRELCDHALSFRMSSKIGMESSG